MSNCLLAKVIILIVKDFIVIYLLQVRITEPYHESQFSSAKTLTEMEGLRTQLRHMIQLTQLQNTSKEERPEKKGNNF